MLKIINETATSYTHRLEFDVLMQDLTARKIEVNFNGWDEWGEAEGFGPLANSIALYKFIVRGLDNDKLTLGWKVSLFNIEQQRLITQFQPYAKRSLQ